MRFGLRLFQFQAFLLICLSLACLSLAGAQAPAEQSAESLRAQLREVEARQSELQERARQLDEEMKPENIERSLALTGSTRPEELRAERRRQLEKDRESVRQQLDQLAASHTRLDAAIATADAAAYRQSAVAPVPAPVSAPAQPPASRTSVAEPTGQVRKQRRRTPRRPRRRRA